MQQPMSQQEQLAAQQAQQQMVLCPVRLVYETQILVQPGDQIQPNQTLFMNPQNTPPWAQNRQVQQNQVIYVQQMGNNIMQTVQQQMDQQQQQQLYLQQFQNFQQIIPQQIIHSPQESRTNQIQIQNMIQPNIMANFQTNVGQNIQLQDARGMQQLQQVQQVHFSPTQQNVNANIQMQQQQNQAQMNLPNNNTTRQNEPNTMNTVQMPQQQQNQINQRVDVKPQFQQTNVGHVNQAQTPNMTRTQPQVLTVNPIQNMPQAINIQTFNQHMIQRPIKTENNQHPSTPHIPKPPKFVNASQNTLITKIRKVAPAPNMNKMNTPNVGIRTMSQPYRTIQPRPQFRHSLPNYPMELQPQIQNAQNMPIIHQNIININPNLQPQSIANIQGSQPISNIQLSQPISNIQISQPVSNIPVSQPSLNIPVSQPISNIQLNQPISNLQANQHISNIPVNQPVLNIHVNQPITNVPVSRPISNTPPVQTISNTTTRPQHQIKLEENTRKRKSESPDEIHKKMASIQVNPNVSVKKISDNQSTEIATNTSPVHRKKVQNLSMPLLFSNDKPPVPTTQVQMSTLVHNVQTAIHEDKANMVKPSEDVKVPAQINISDKDKDKLIRNTVFTQARGRVLTDKELHNAPVNEVKMTSKEQKPLIIIENVKVEFDKTFKRPEPIKNEIKREKQVPEADARAKTDTDKSFNITNVVKSEKDAHGNKVEKKDREMDVSLNTTNNKGMFPMGKCEQEKDFVLTHVLDGIVIQESNVAFPIREPLTRRMAHNKLNQVSTDRKTRNTEKRGTDSKSKEKREQESKELEKEPCPEVKDDQKRLEGVTQGASDSPFSNLSTATVKTWTTSELSDHLIKYGWSEAAALFQDHEIDGESLFLVSKSQLQTIGVKEEQADVICAFVKS